MFQQVSVSKISSFAKGSLRDAVVFSKKDGLDYSPYGTLLHHRHGTQTGSDSYRYAFQGQEKDDEIKGEGNSYNYEYRMHDPRIGRFFAIDPLTPKYPFYTPYAFSGNRLIDAHELEGLEPEITVIISPGSTVNLTDVTTASVIAALAGQNPASGNSNSTATNQANPPDVSSVPTAPSGSGLDVSVQSAVVVWDPTARARGQAGQIQYIGLTGVGIETRGLTANELADPFINAAVTMNTESTVFQRKLSEANPTDMSGGVNSASPFDGTTTIEASRFVVVTGQPSPVNLTTAFIPNTAIPTGGSGTLSPDDIATLNRVANVLLARPGMFFDVVGNIISGTMAEPVSSTDPTPTWRLAINRASVHTNYLRSLGVPAAQLSANPGDITGVPDCTGTFRISRTFSPPNNGNIINIVTP